MNLNQSNKYDREKEASPPTIILKVKVTSLSIRSCSGTEIGGQQAEAFPASSHSTRAEGDVSEVAHRALLSVEVLVPVEDALVLPGEVASSLLR